MMIGGGLGLGRRGRGMPGGGLGLGGRGRGMRGVGRRARPVLEADVEEIRQEGDRDAGGGRDLEWCDIHLRELAAVPATGVATELPFASTPVHRRWHDWVAMEGQP